MAPNHPPLAPAHEYSLCSVNQWPSASLQILFSGFQRAEHSGEWVLPPRGRAGHQWGTRTRVTLGHHGSPPSTKALHIQHLGIKGARILKSSFACLFYDLPLVAALSIMTTRRNYSCYVLLQINSPPDPLQIIGLLGRGAQSSYCGSSWGRFSDPLQSQSSCNSDRFC